MDWAKRTPLFRAASTQIAEMPLRNTAERPVSPERVPEPGVLLCRKFPRNDSSPDRSVALSASTALHVSEYHLQLWSTSVLSTPFCLRWVIAEKAPYTSRDSSTAPTGETSSSHADRIPRSALPPAEEKGQMSCSHLRIFVKSLCLPWWMGSGGQIVVSGIYGHRLQLIHPAHPAKLDTWARLDGGAVKKCRLTASSPAKPACEKKFQI